MQSKTLYRFVRSAIVTVPDVVPMLSGKASTLAPTAYKTYEYFLSTLESMVSNVYNGFMGNEFINIMGNLIGGQLLKAYEQAWEDSGMTTWPIPDFLQESLDSFLMTQGDYIEPFYRDILTAGVDRTGLDPLLSRAATWANQYTNAYNEATRQISLVKGDRMVWHYGDTDHCSTCQRLDGIVAFADEWEQSGFRPQNPPNNLLECGGWRCQCSLEVTDRRRSPKALDTLMNIAVGGFI